jgi:hypothetical protein
MMAMGVSLIAFAVIFAGVFIGALLHRALPGHHLEDAKDVVRLGTGLIGTIAALVLGLLIGSAKGSYDTQNTQMKTVTADIILLDQVLAQYGPETHELRDLVRRAVGSLIDRIWTEKPADTGVAFASSAAADVAYTKLLELAPQTESQRAWKSRAVQLSIDLAQARLALFVRATGPIPVPFLAVLVFWLTIIFASFTLFSRLNPTLIVALFICALSASGAIYLILELGQPFSGLMQISSAPLRNALAPL